MMEPKRLAPEDIIIAGEKVLSAKDNEFTFDFNISNFSHPLPKFNEKTFVAELHSLLRDETALSLVKTLLELNEEHELKCNDGKYSLVDLHPYPINEGFNIEVLPSLINNEFSDTFLLGIAVQRNQVAKKHDIRIVMELSSDINVTNYQSVRAKVRFTEIDEIPGAILYLTLVSLMRILENCNLFISGSLNHESSDYKQRYTVLPLTPMRHKVEVQKRMADYIFKRISKTIERRTISDEELVELINCGLVPSSAKMLRKNLATTVLNQISYEDIIVETRISHNAEIYYIPGKSHFENQINIEFKEHCKIVYLYL